MGLKRVDSVHVVIKSTEVMIQKPRQLPARGIGGQFQIFQDACAGLEAGERAAVHAAVHFKFRYVGNWPRVGTHFAVMGDAAAAQNLSRR